MVDFCGILSRAEPDAGALVAHRAALAIWEQSLPPTHPHIAGSHSNIGGALQAAGYHAGAVAELRQALRICSLAGTMGLQFYNVLCLQSYNLMGGDAQMNLLGDVFALARGPSAFIPPPLAALAIQSGGYETFFEPGLKN